MKNQRMPASFCLIYLIALFPLALSEMLFGEARFHVPLPDVSHAAGNAYTAQILSLWSVEGASPGRTSTLWAQVKNIGSASLTSNAHVWFWVDGPNWSANHWIGSASTASLQPGHAQWYSIDWMVPANAPVGVYTYWAQVWTDVAISEWSPGQYFPMTRGEVPGKVTLISPNGTITSSLPTYTWKAVPKASWYYLYVDDSMNSPKINAWFTAEEAGCLSGEGICSITPKTPISNGPCRWWIQTWNDNGYGPWTEPTAFTYCTLLLVSNSSDKVDGDTSSIDALFKNPGKDGISFREAIQASNNTKEYKLIRFAQALSGATIQYGSAGLDTDVIILKSGNLIIDGDIDGDGKPDVTLAGTLAYRHDPLSVGMAVWSSNNTIRNLTFNDFLNVAIMIACPGSGSANSHISDISIINNTISYSRGEFGIQIGTVGLTLPDELPKLSGNVISDISILGNRIFHNNKTSENGPLYIVPSAGGSSSNRIKNLMIKDNNISGGVLGISILAADAASDYFNIYNPIFYSDNNSVEDIVISDNIVQQARHGGIVIGVANWGNRNNSIKNVKVTGNTVLEPGWVGITLQSGGDGSTRSTENSLLDEVEVTGNRVVGGSYGIELRAGCDNNPGMGVIGNLLQRVLIKDNNLSGFRQSGIMVVGGQTQASAQPGTSSENVVDVLTIDGNHISTSANSNSVGLTVLGGKAELGSAHDNIVRGISVLNNLFDETPTGMLLVGGRGTGAVGNSVALSNNQGNTIGINGTLLRTIENDQGATANTIKIPR